MAGDKKTPVQQKAIAPKYEPKNGSSAREMSQSDFPRESLSKALRIAQGLWDNFAGKSAAPHDIAMALEVSPTSSSWRVLCGTSIAYGLTEGGYNALQISLTPLGRRIVAPTVDGDDVAARITAVQKPRIMGEFFKRYDRAKFPADPIAQNVLVSLGIPKERAANALTVLRENGRQAGIIRDTKTGPFVALEVSGALRSAPSDSSPALFPIEDEEATSEESTPPPTAPASASPTKNNRVFITHGKNRQVVDQLKELLVFGKYDPVISVERETRSIPVPEKVLQDMRSCSAAVINVSSEGELLDATGNKHIHINDNVLIEIGAAMALYEKNFVLLVQKGVELPSNLQGLYRCEYDGDRLDYEATMKLLKTFSQFT